MLFLLCLHRARLVTCTDPVDRDHVFEPLGPRHRCGADTEPVQVFYQALLNQRKLGREGRVGGGEGRLEGGGGEEEIGVEERFHCNLVKGFQLLLPANQAHTS